MKTVDYTRYPITVEVRFKEGIECCKWCNYSFVNKKGHFQCVFTGEEMVSPESSIGWECPLRKEGIGNVSKFETG